MKKLVIALLCVYAIVSGEMVRTTIETRLDRYAAELAADQMDAEGSAEYEAYRRNAETVLVAIGATEAVAFGVAALCAIDRIKKTTKNKE